MKKAILSAAITLIVGLLVMSAFPNAKEIGVLAAVAVMGACIIYFNEKKNS